MNCVSSIATEKQKAIKKIKIKKSDGTFTDYLPLGSDAEYIDLENGNNLQEEINHMKKASESENVRVIE